MRRILNLTLWAGERSKRDSASVLSGEGATAAGRVSYQLSIGCNQQSPDRLISLSRDYPSSSVLSSALSAPNITRATYRILHLSL